MYVVRDCLRCLDFLSGKWPLTDLSPRAQQRSELARACTLLPESSSIKLCMPLASFKLDFGTWHLMDRRRMNQLLVLDRDIISTTVSMLKVIALWVDTRKVCGSHSTTSSVGADQLREKRLLSTSSVSAFPLLGTGTNCLALCFLSAWRNYRLFTSRI